MNSVIVDIRISADEFLRYYGGAAQDVVARARDGRTIRFPAKILQQFVTRSGIEGSFQIDFSSQGKFERIQRLP